MLSLYELTGRYRQLLELAADGEEEWFADTLESIEDEIKVKAENLAYVIRNLEAEATAIEEEEKRLKARRQSAEKHIQRLKSYVLEQLEAAGIQKVKGTLFTVSVAKNASSVKVHDESLVPKHFWIPKPSELSKTAIKEAIKAGEKVPGCSLVAGKSVRIK